VKFLLSFFEKSENQYSETKNFIWLVLRRSFSDALIESDSVWTKGTLIRTATKNLYKSENNIDKLDTGGEFCLKKLNSSFICRAESDDE
jgi:hypothetical protein